MIQLTPYTITALMLTTEKHHIGAQAVIHEIIFLVRAGSILAAEGRLNAIEQRDPSISVEAMALGAEAKLLQLAPEWPERMAA